LERELEKSDLHEVKDKEYWKDRVGQVSFSAVVYLSLITYVCQQVLPQT